MAWSTCMAVTFRRSIVMMMLLIRRDRRISAGTDVVVSTVPVSSTLARYAACYGLYGAVLALSGVAFFIGLEHSKGCSRRWTSDGKSTISFTSGVSRCLLFCSLAS